MLVEAYFPNHKLLLYQLLANGSLYTCFGFVRQLLTCFHPVSDFLLLMRVSNFPVCRLPVVYFLLNVDLMSYLSCDILFSLRFLVLKIAVMNFHIFIDLYLSIEE